VPLGVVGDVFGVMAQVDRRLTKVNSIDLLIRINYPGRKPGASQPTPLKQTGAWSTMELGFFSRSSSKLPLEAIDEDGESACSMSGRSNDGEGLVVGWPKNKPEGQEWRHCRARDLVRLGNSNTAGGFPFLYPNRNATVIPTD
jgi:hypothetical protein